MIDIINKETQAACGFEWELDTPDVCSVGRVSYAPQLTPSPWRIARDILRLVALGRPRQGKLSIEYAAGEKTLRLDFGAMRWASNRGEGAFHWVDAHTPITNEGAVDG